MRKHVFIRITALVAVAANVACPTSAAQLERIDPAAAPFRVPAGALVTRHSANLHGYPAWVYIVTQHAPRRRAPQGPGFTADDFNQNFHVGRELGKCRQRVSSRQGWSATEPNNFIQINGSCAGHTFADPSVLHADRGQPCLVDFRHDGVTAVSNCVVDGAEVLAFSFSNDCCPSSKSVYGILRR